MLSNHLWKDKGDRRLASLCKKRIWCYQEMLMFHLRCSGHSATIFSREGIF